MTNEFQTGETPEQAISAWREDLLPLSSLEIDEDHIANDGNVIEINEEKIRNEEIE